MLRTFDDPRKERQHRALQRALRERGVKIYHCQDCGYIFLGSTSKPPKRCANRACRAPAQGRKRMPAEEVVD